MESNFEGKLAREHNESGRNLGRHEGIGLEEWRDSTPEW